MYSKDNIREYNRQYYLKNKHKWIEYHKKYYQGNREKLKECSRKWKYNNKEKCKERRRKYYHNNKDKFKIYRIRYMEKTIKYYNLRYHTAKNKLFDILGGKKCVRCGITDERVLQFDHINGGGTRENKKGFMIYKHIKDPNIKSKLQVLCSNCNWIKRHEKKEHK